jgi:hypothetical protein
LRWLCEHSDARQEQNRERQANTSCVSSQGIHS